MNKPQTEIVAEIANAHQGDPDQARQIAEAVLAAGADAVKFQIYSAEELLVRAHPRYEHFRQQAFSAEVWKELIAPLVDAGVRVYCDVFGLDALDIAIANGVHGIKVHSSDLANDHLLEAAAQTDKKVLLAVGGSTVKEIGHAVDKLSGRDIRPMLLHGFQSYPTAVDESCLDRMRWLHDLFGSRCDIGYMDHIDADDPFATVVPLMALTYGITMLEKHVTMDRAAKGVDYYSSFNPDEFQRFVETVREAEAAVVDRVAWFANGERQYRDSVKKHWVARHDLAKGARLSADDLIMKRLPEGAAGPVELERLAGRILCRDIAEEEPLTRADVENTVWASIVARSASARLPGKAVMDMAGMPALAHLFARIRQAESVDHIVFCTTVEADDDHLAELAKDCGIAVHRGSVEDVLGRQLGAFEGHEVDLVLRITGDDILVDPEQLDLTVGHHLKMNAEYTDAKRLPSGTEVEVFDTSLLRMIHAGALDPDGTEYLTTYIVDNADQIRMASYPAEPRHDRDWRLTLDTPEDLKVIRRLLEGMAAAGKPLDYRLDDIVDFMEANPEVPEINAGVRQRQTPPEVDTRIDWKRFA